MLPGSWIATPFLRVLMAFQIDALHHRSLKGCKSVSCHSWKLEKIWHFGFEATSYNHLPEKATAGQILRTSKFDSWQISILLSCKDVDHLLKKHWSTLSRWVLVKRVAALWRYVIPSQNVPIFTMFIYKELLIFLSHCSCNL